MLSRDLLGGCAQKGDCVDGSGDRQKDLDGSIDLEITQIQLVIDDMGLGDIA